MVLSILLFKKSWMKPGILMMLTMLVDLDHLLATPVYDPGRCSIGFHPLHQPYLMVVYGFMALLTRTRWIGVGLLIHMLLDWQDCFIN